MDWACRIACLDTITFLYHSCWHCNHDTGSNNFCFPEYIRPSIGKSCTCNQLCVSCYRLGMGWDVSSKQAGRQHPSIKIDDLSSPIRRLLASSALQMISSSLGSLINQGDRHVLSFFLFHNSNLHSTYLFSGIPNSERHSTSCTNRPFPKID